MKITMTMDWKKKKTQAEPTAASARISRGNETFLTRPALFTTTPVPVRTPGEKRFHSRSPANRKMTKFGILLLRRMLEDEEVDGQGHGRGDHRPDQAEDRVLVLDLDLGADQVDQQLAGQPDLAQPLAHAEVGVTMRVALPRRATRALAPPAWPPSATVRHRSSAASSTLRSASDEEAGTSRATSMFPAAARGRRTVDDLVDEAVLAGLVGGEPAVAVRVGLDALERLAGVEGDALGHHPLQVDDLLGLDGDVGRLALHGPRGLVHQDAGVRAGRSACPGAPAHSRNWPMLAASPTQMVETSGCTYCMVS